MKLVSKSLVLKLSLATFVASAIGIGIASASASIIPPGRCICTDNYAPVLCPNGITYSNSCRASCAGQRNCVPVGDR